MISDLEFIRGEVTKIQKELGKTPTRNYKKYLPLYQAYMAATNTLAQMEAIQKQREENQKRELENKMAAKEAKEEMELEETKKSNKN